jgi:hypothetical protein
MIGGLEIGEQCWDAGMLELRDEWMIPLGKDGWMSTNHLMIELTNNRAGDWLIR